MIKHKRKLNPIRNYYSGSVFVSRSWSVSVTMSWSGSWFWFGSTSWSRSWLLSRLRLR